MSKQAEVTAIIKAYESRRVSFEDARARILALTGVEVEMEELEEYWSSRELADFVRNLCMPPIEDWRQITDEDALRLLREIRADLCDDAIIRRNREALEKRYGKPSGAVTDMIFQRSMEPEAILRELKRDTKFYL